MIKAKIMIKEKTKKYSAVLLAGFFMLGSLSTSALSGGLYSIEKYSINSGGTVSSGSNFSLTGTIAQSDAGVTASSANFSLSGGFWAGGSSDIIFINGFENMSLSNN